MANSACEYQAVGTAVPPSSGTPVQISASTGTVISANFFNSGAITNPDTEFVEVCVMPAQTNAQQTAEIITDIGLDDNTLIKAYPEFIVGTKFGNIWETSFRYYNNNGLAPEDQWPVTSTNGYEFANQEYVSSLIGLPAFTNSLPVIDITLDMDEQNIVGANRDVMLESWFYDTSTNSTLIGDNTTTSQPVSNTLNNIIGIGHPAYDDLNNTILEMMVHVGALSPYDISGSVRSPGQQRLTENLNGLPDSDLDCINDAVDVDITGGIDLDGDGVDDSKLAPVMIGSYVYSLWYGTSELAPIVIFSRETNENCEYNMDLTTEGEITLNWNDFIDFTLNDFEPLLQAANVSWVTGADNPFPKMRAGSGAIGGVEFGVEPQTNVPADLPYTATINKLDIVVDGVSLGLSPADTEAPIADITFPVNAGDTIPVNSTLTGYASDTGGSGFKFVSVLLLNIDTGQYYDFDNNSLTSTWTQKLASLTNTDTFYTDWSLSVSLPDGQYRLYSIAHDNAGNEATAGNGFRQWTTREFTVDTIDPAPTTDITFPANDGNNVSSMPLLTGTATDLDGSGFSFVRTVLINLDNGHFYDAASGTFSAGWKQNFAALSNIGNTFTNWQLAVVLPSANYRLYAITRDADGNEPLNTLGFRQWTTRDFYSPPANENPSSDINFPANNGDSIPASSVLTGSATDLEGSGFLFVRTVLINLGTGQFYDASTQTLTAGWKQNFAQLLNSTPSSTDWQLTVTLPDGFYRLLTIARNNNGNEPLQSNGTRAWTSKDFMVQSSP